MIRLFKPKYKYESITVINFNKLYDKGYRGILFDIDNTLVPHGESSNKNINEFLLKIKNIGFRIGLISNNDKNRVDNFNELELPNIFKANKPLPKSYIKLIKQLNCNKKDIIFIGDQLFTDILGANLAGIDTILVKPISKKEPFQIKLKRRFEKIFMRGKYGYTREN